MKEQLSMEKVCLIYFSIANGMLKELAICYAFTNLCYDVNKKASKTENYCVYDKIMYSIIMQHDVSLSLFYISLNDYSKFNTDAASL